MPFQHYDPENKLHIRNAANLLAKLFPDTYYMTGMAFALIINPVLSCVGYEVPPPKYQIEKENECPLVEI